MKIVTFKPTAVWPGDAQPSVGSDGSARVGVEPNIGFEDGGRWMADRSPDDELADGFAGWRNLPAPVLQQFFS